MGFSLENFTVQALYMAFIAKIKEHRLAFKKAKGIIINSIIFKNQAALEGKLAKEMWESLKAKFRQISPMSISCFLLETTRIQLSECSNIHKYCGKYQEAYSAIYNMISADCELSAKGVAMILQAGLLTGMGDEYSSIVFTMESEWTNGATDLDSSILRLIRFANIKKENARNQLAPSPAALLTTKPPKPGSNQALPGTYTFPNYIKKGLITHYPDYCLLKYPELWNKLQTKYSLQQMKPKGSKGNLQKE